MAPRSSNGAAKTQALSQVPNLISSDAAAANRKQAHEAFGKIVLTLIETPRYRHFTIAELKPMILEPLARDRIVIAKAKGENSEIITAIAIWATVSEAVNAKIKEQIAAHVFPVRLKPEDWTSGSINWLLDVIAPSSKYVTSLLTNFGKVAKSGALNIHPLVAKQVDNQTLKAMGATSVG